MQKESGLEYYHFTIPKKITNTGEDQQNLLKSSGEKLLGNFTDQGDSTCSHWLILPQNKKELSLYAS